MLKINYKKPKHSDKLNAYTLYRMCKTLLGEPADLNLHVRMRSVKDYNNRAHDRALLHYFKLEAIRLSSLGWNTTTLSKQLYPLVIACSNNGFSVDIKLLSSFLMHITFQPTTNTISDKHKAWVEAEINKLISGDDNA